MLYIVQLESPTFSVKILQWIIVQKHINLIFYTNNHQFRVSIILTVLHCCSALSLVWVFLHLSCLRALSPSSSHLWRILSVTLSTWFTELFVFFHPNSSILITFSISKLFKMPNFSKGTFPWPETKTFSALQVGSLLFWQSTRQWKWSRMLDGFERTSTRLKKGKQLCGCCWFLCQPKSFYLRFLLCIHVNNSNIWLILFTSFLQMYYGKVYCWQAPQLANCTHKSCHLSCQHTIHEKRLLKLFQL